MSPSDILQMPVSPTSEAPNRLSGSALRRSDTCIRQNGNTESEMCRIRESDLRYGFQTGIAWFGQLSLPIRKCGRTARIPKMPTNRLFQLECFVQHAGGQFHVFLVDQYRNFDFGSGNHLDVDAFFGQCAEHFGSHAHV